MRTEERARARSHTHTHTRNHLTAFCLGLPGVSRYQKKHSPTNAREEDNTNKVSFDPIKPAHNHCRLDGWLKLTASTFNWL